MKAWNFLQLRFRESKTLWDIIPFMNLRPTNFMKVLPMRRSWISDHARNKRKSMEVWDTRQNPTWKKLLIVLMTEMHPRLLKLTNSLRISILNTREAMSWKRILRFSISSKKVKAWDLKTILDPSPRTGLTKTEKNPNSCRRNSLMAQLPLLLKKLRLQKEIIRLISSPKICSRNFMRRPCSRLPLSIQWVITLLQEVSTTKTSWSKSKSLMPNRRFKRTSTLWTTAFRPPRSGWTAIMTGEPRSKVVMQEDRIGRPWVRFLNPLKCNVRIFTQLLSLRHNSNVTTWTAKWFHTSFLLRRQDQTSWEHVNIRILWVVAQTITPSKSEMTPWTARIETAGLTILVPKESLRSFHSRIWTIPLINPNLIPVEWPPRKIYKVPRSVMRIPQRDSCNSSWTTIISQWLPPFHQN